MKRYEMQLDNMLIYLGEGYVIGLVIAFIISWISYKEICVDFFGMGVVLAILIGSAISMILMSAKGIQNAALNMSFGFIKNLFSSFFSAGFGSGLLLFISFLKFMFCIFVSMIIFLYMMVSFPLTILYTVIMYFVEKAGKDIDESTANKLDKLVPIISFLITALILYILFKGNDENSVNIENYTISENAELEKTAENNEEKPDLTASENLAATSTAASSELVVDETTDSKPLSLGEYNVSTGERYLGLISNVFVEKGEYSVELFGFQGPHYVNKTDFENVEIGDTYPIDDWNVYYCIAITEDGYWYSWDPETNLETWDDTVEVIYHIKITEEEDGMYPVYFKSCDSIDPDALWPADKPIVADTITIGCISDCPVTFKNVTKPITEMDIDEMLYKSAYFELDENGNIIYLDTFVSVG